MSRTTESALTDTISFSSQDSVQGGCRSADVELTLQPHGALVIPFSTCARLGLVPGGAACVIIRQQQWRGAVAVLCAVCPSTPSNVTFHFELFIESKCHTFCTNVINLTFCVARHLIHLQQRSLTITAATQSQLPLDRPNQIFSRFRPMPPSVASSPVSAMVLPLPCLIEPLTEVLCARKIALRLH
jgi:hypothetical protein